MSQGDVGWLAPAPVRGARAAFAFMSRIPVGGFPYRDRDWRWAPAHYPLVGLAVGLCVGGTFELMRSLDPLVAAVLAVATGIRLTGAFHEDGLADSADGIGGAHGGKSMLEIMKDSRVGTYGGLALVLSVLLRVACLRALGDLGLWAAVLAHTLSRVGPVWLLQSQPYVTLEGQSKSRTVAQAQSVQVAVALAWGLTVLGGLIYWGALPVLSSLAVPLLWVANLLCARHFRRVAGGITGDFLGATQQMAEMGVLLLLLLLIRHGT